MGVGQTVSWDGITGPGPTDSERRRSLRFLLECELHYKTANRRSRIVTGKGKTLNISSSGILFSSEHNFPLLTELEVSVSWPVPLNKTVPLNLVARGRVVRCSEGQLALQIAQYEFRVRRHDYVEAE